MKNLGKSLQNLRLAGVFPMERLTQALIVNAIKYIRQKKGQTSHLYLFIYFPAQARNLNRAGLKGTFHKPAVHLCLPGPSSSIKHVHIETRAGLKSTSPRILEFRTDCFQVKNPCKRKSQPHIEKNNTNCANNQVRASEFTYICMKQGTYSTLPALCQQNAFQRQLCCGCKQKCGMEPSAQGYVALHLS